MPAKKKEIFIQSHVDKFVEEKRSKSTKQAKDRYKMILQEYVNEFTSGYTPKKKNIDNVGAEAFGRSFESIKHTIPEYELDTEYLHNIVRAELAVIKADEEKKKQDNMKIYLHGYDDKRQCGVIDLYTPRVLYKYVNVKNWYSKGYLENIKARFIKYIVQSIILSLGLGATIGFIIN